MLPAGSGLTGGDPDGGRLVSIRVDAYITLIWVR